MNDWKAIAATGRVPADQVERIAPTLDTLETVFRPLADTLTFDEEPAATFEAEGAE